MKKRLDALLHLLILDSICNLQHIKHGKRTVVHGTANSSTEHHHTLNSACSCVTIQHSPRQWCVTGERYGREETANGEYYIQETHTKQDTMVCCFEFLSRPEDHEDYGG